MNEIPPPYLHLQPFFSMMEILPTLLFSCCSFCGGKETVPIPELLVCVCLCVCVCVKPKSLGVLICCVFSWSPCRMRQNDWKEKSRRKPRPSERRSQKSTTSGWTSRTWSVNYTTLYIHISLGSIVCVLVLCVLDQFIA